jgi:tripartite motif-containing protein 71
VFNKDGKYLREWAAGFYGPRGIGVDAQGRVYVVDTGNNRIVRFSPAGGKEVEWGKKGSGPGEFLEPVGVATDAAGNVYIADNGNGRLQIFTADGRFVGAFPGLRSQWQAPAHHHRTADCGGVLRHPHGYRPQQVEG